MPRANPPDPRQQRPVRPASKAAYSRPIHGTDSPEEAAARRRRSEQTGQHRCVCEPWPCDPGTCTPCVCARSRTDRAGHCKTCGACRACGLAGRPFYTAEDLRFIETGKAS